MLRYGREERRTRVKKRYADICLPLRSVLPRDRAYLGALLSFTAVAFLVICACYLRMYQAVRGGQDARAAMQRSDVTRCAVQVAKRMTLLVLTDFACWAPIAFFGATALLGAPLIDVPRTKILLVFFYPLNACANPYLYALLTRQFRNDLLNLLSRSKLFASGAARTRRFLGQRGSNKPVLLLQQLDILFYSCNSQTSSPIGLS
ncbi:hypothetical protein FOCC_FOCC002866 [Frankliniella occidentalis]|nr:hypothetical protein FOCC_FOCC002866 [Frankliniella occidentalis]